MNFFRRIISFIRFLGRNIWATRKLPVIKEVKEGPYVIQGCTPNKVSELNEVYKLFHDGRSMERSKLILYKIQGRKLAFVILEKEKIIGMALFYFNARDIIERTIHQGFLGVVTTHQGKGIGIITQRAVFGHFSNVDELGGLSARVSQNNERAIKTNEKIGYKPIEMYYDNYLNENRYYILCKFEDVNL